MSYDGNTSNDLRSGLLISIYSLYALYSSGFILNPSGRMRFRQRNPEEDLQRIKYRKNDPKS